MKMMGLVGRSGLTHSLKAAILVVTLFVVSFSGAKPVEAEEGCPGGQLPSQLKDGCSSISTYTELPMDVTKPMVFEAIQDSMTTIYVQATGTITAETPDRLAAFLRSDDGKMAAGSSKIISFHSPGGDITAGIKLGEIIRKARLSTDVGHSVHLSDPFDNFSYKSADCAGACALAFVGGIDRSYRAGDRFGFGVLQADAAPSISSYLKRMGINPAVLQSPGITDRLPVASARQMRIINHPEITKPKA